MNRCPPFILILFSLLILSKPASGQIAVAVVSDVPETMTNIHRFQHYTAQLEHGLKEIEYWIQTAEQLNLALERIGQSGTFWNRVDRLLDTLDIGYTVAGDRGWPTGWYPDSEFGLVRATTRFGAQVQDIWGHIEEDPSLGTILSQSRAAFGSTRNYLETVEAILAGMAEREQHARQQVREIQQMEIDEGAGLSGWLEKETALSTASLAQQARTHDLVQVLVRTGLEHHAEEQWNRMVDWQYQWAVETAEVNRFYDHQQAALVEAEMAARHEAETFSEPSNREMQRRERRLFSENEPGRR